MTTEQVNGMGFWFKAYGHRTSVARVWTWGTVTTFEISPNGEQSRPRNSTDTLDDLIAEGYQFAGNENSWQDCKQLANLVPANTTAR